MTVPVITALPTPPVRGDAPSDFSAKADAFAAALPGLVSEANAAAAFVDQRAADADSSAAAAAASEAAAEADRAEVAANTATVASNTATVVARADEVAANALQVASNTQQVATDAQAVADALASIADGPVASVNSKTGVVTLTAADVGAEPADASIVKTAAVQTLTNKTFTGYTETVHALAGTDINPANGTIQYVTLAANTTFTESLADGQSVTLMINPVTFSVTWPAATWIGAKASTAPTLVASVYNCIVLFKFGGVLYAKYEGRV